MNDDKKSLSFWVVLLCFILGILETIFLSFGVDFVINIIVEAVAVLLSLLVYFGILKKDDDKSISENYEEIKKNLKNQENEEKDNQDKEEKTE